MRISDWSSDVCSSDLLHHQLVASLHAQAGVDVRCNGALLRPKLNIEQSRFLESVPALIPTFAPGLTGLFADKIGPHQIASITGLHSLVLDRQSTRLNSSP